jgi:hypothetical protein
VSTNFTLMVITDGRKECLKETIKSADEHLQGLFTQRLMVNDCLDPEYRQWLGEEFYDFEIIHHTEKRGFCGSIVTGWRATRIPPTGTARADYIFHLEDDFTFNRPVDLTAMAAVLAGHPYLAQLVLKRQPWNDEEKAAGGIVEQWPNEYREMNSPHGSWLEHRLFFSTNPCMYPISLIEKHKWPMVPRCEGEFTKELLMDPDLRFAFWGRREDEPWVHHIGDQRVGTGY